MLDKVLLLQTYRSYVNAIVIGAFLLIGFSLYFAFKRPNFLEPGVHTLNEKEIIEINSLPQIKSQENRKGDAILIIPSEEAVHFLNGNAILKAVLNKVSPWVDRGILLISKTPKENKFSDKKLQKIFEKYISNISIYVRPTKQYFVVNVRNTSSQVASQVELFLREVSPLK